MERQKRQKVLWRETTLARVQDFYLSFSPTSLSVSYTARPPALALIDIILLCLHRVATPAAPPHAIGTSGAMRLLRLYSTHNSRHKLWYTDTLPALVPVFLLGSAVYLGLQLTHLRVSHERHMEESSDRIKQLETEIETLQAERVKKLPPRESPKKGWWW